VSLQLREDVHCLIPLLPRLLLMWLEMNAGGFSRIRESTVEDFVLFVSFLKWKNKESDYEKRMVLSHYCC